MAIAVAAIAAIAVSPPPAVTFAVSIAVGNTVAAVSFHATFI